MSKIITRPFVEVVAKSALNFAGVEQFIAENDLRDLLTSDEVNPINNLRDFEGDDLEVIPEFGGRFCYRSWAKGRPTTEYNANILEMEHGSVLEHATISFVIQGVSRALTHEMIRHRVGTAISQESQRYVDAADINFVMPPLLLHFLEGDTDCEEARQWHSDNQSALASYEMWQEYLNISITKGLQDGTISIDADLDTLDISHEQKVKKQFTRIKKRANEAARSQLPNASETRLLWTANLRTIRHFIMLRGADPADLEIRRLAVEIALWAKDYAPSIFHDIEIIPGSFGVDVVTGKHNKV